MVRQGFLYALLVMICWGTAPIFAKIGLSKLPPLTALVFRNTFIAIMFLSAMFINGSAKTIFTSDIRSVVFILIEALLAGLIGQYFYYKAVKVWEASRVVPIVGAFPLVTFFIAVLVLSEKVTLLKVLGALFIVAGVGLLGI